MMIIDVSDPTSRIADLHPLDTFYHNGDLWVLSNSIDSAGNQAALNLISGSIVALPRKTTSVVKVDTTITSTAALKAIEDLAEV